MRKRRVVIEVSGGVAEVTKCPKDVEVEIIDHDNLKELANEEEFRRVLEGEAEI